MDRFIGWNFGKAVDESDELKASLSHIVNLLKERGLREEAKPGFNVWTSKDVWHVKYADDGTPIIFHV